MSQHVVTSTSRQKRRFPPIFRLFYRDASRIKSEQSRRRDYVVIALQLCHDASQRNFDVAMRHDLRRDLEKIQKT